MPTDAGQQDGSDDDTGGEQESPGLAHASFALVTATVPVGGGRVRLFLAE